MSMEDILISASVAVMTLLPCPLGLFREDSSSIHAETPAAALDASLALSLSLVSRFTAEKSTSFTPIEADVEPCNIPTPGASVHNGIRFAGGGTDGIFGTPSESGIDCPYDDGVEMDTVELLSW